ncbi:hypothetical protein DFR70_12856 [Nocardia tenerifensis]|uniref:Uncharacterized protein n=1 Tax=Nocardia tenerifensis TaxID=228006 RepID=A0A318JNN6_9NOCA|nr:hypothetical protein [Nocardia tenerifensis]PXX53343.1 hypothetical protein DFR70_12856 [Nocardia tenerifensis]
MFDQFMKILETVQNEYLHDPELTDEAARRVVVQGLLDKQELIAASIWDKRFGLPQLISGSDAIRNVRHTLDEAAAEVVETEIIGRIPSRVVHERRHALVYLEAEITPQLDHEQVDTGRTSTAHWLARAAEKHVEVDYASDVPTYTGVDPIEDVALPPDVPWSDADKKAGLERAIGVYGLGPGQWIELEWPPNGSLTYEGFVYWTQFESCEAHAESDETQLENCAECTQPKRVVEEPARWTFYTTMTINAISFDQAGIESSREVYRDNLFEVAVIEQDPGDLVIGPSDPRSLW